MSQQSTGASDCERPDFSPAQDRLAGAEQIAAFLGINVRQCRYRLDRGLIPHAKEGSLHVASRSALVAHWRKVTGGATEAA